MANKIERDEPVTLTSLFMSLVFQGVIQFTALHVHDRPYMYTKKKIIYRKK